MQIPALLLPAITLVTVNNNHAILGLANPLQYGRLGRFWLREAPSMRQSPYLGTPAHLEGSTLQSGEVPRHFRTLSDELNRSKCR